MALGVILVPLSQSLKARRDDESGLCFVRARRRGAKGLGSVLGAWTEGKQRTGLRGPQDVSSCAARGLPSARGTI